MVPARLAVPFTVRLEEPVLLVIVLPLSITKLFTVRPVCRSKVAVPVKVRLLVVEPKVPVLVTTTLPALIVVVPPL